jgi:hypothetical protein
MHQYPNPTLTLPYLPPHPPPPLFAGCQALEYWDIVLHMVEKVIFIYWPNRRNLVGDPHVRYFMLQSINEMQATSGFVTGSHTADIEEGASWDELAEAS